jgi:hypothetical protein
MFAGIWIRPWIRMSDQLEETDSGDVLDDLAISKENRVTSSWLLAFDTHRRLLTDQLCLFYVS